MTLWVDTYVNFWPEWKHYITLYNWTHSRHKKKTWDRQNSRFLASHNGFHSSLWERYVTLGGGFEFVKPPSLFERTDPSNVVITTCPIYIQWYLGRVKENRTTGRNREIIYPVFFYFPFLWIPFGMLGWIVASVLICILWSFLSLKCFGFLEKRELMDFRIVINKILIV